jgi:methylamine utilization protein MauE
MVETITPVVHGGRGRRWAIPLTLHAVGATAAAAAFGALAAALGARLDAPWGAGAAIVAILAAVYLAGELLGVRVPVPQLRRQVPEWWRTFFPFGVASLLYGVGLGVGFLTYLSHGTLLVVAVAATVSGDPLVGALLLAPFGLARGLSVAIAGRARTPGEGASLVRALGRSASWSVWRVAHAVALSAVMAASLAALRETHEPADLGSLAAAVVALAFASAAIAKLARPGLWRRTLGSYGLPAWVERPARVGVPAVELGLAVLPLLGLGSSAGLGAVVVLAVFSGAVVLARIRTGPRLGCGCFGGAKARDWRWLLARNAAFAAAGAVAWRSGVDAPVAFEIGIPRGAELLPAALVVLGFSFAIWVGVRTLVAVRRAAGR